MSNDPLMPHSHDPNLTPPAGDGSFRLILPNGRSRKISLSDLRRLPKTAVANCTIVSTGHGTSGPFTFSGVRLAEFIRAVWPEGWSQVEVISVDGFGNRLFAKELAQEKEARPIILAYERDHTAMKRPEGVVRLIVPSETDDALRQVKWIGEMRIRP